VVSTLTGVFFIARYLGRRFDRWANAVVDNSDAMRSLTERVRTLESVATNATNILNGKKES